MLSLGLCISIRVRRRRAAIRERRQRLAIAEPITAWDHGEDGPEDGDTFGQLRNTGEPAMSQAAPAPFVPRYFPGSTPASPPPYNAAAPSVSVALASPLAVSMSRSGLPVSVPSTLPPTIPTPEPTFDLYRTGSNQSYADRPPPTPSSEEARFVFGAGSEDDRASVRTGGIVGPLPPESPVADETDPMLGDSHEHVDEMREAYRDDDDDAQQTSFAAVRRSSLRSSISYTQSSGSGSAGPSNSTTSSDRQFRRASSFSFASSTDPTSVTPGSSPDDSGPSTPRTKRLSVGIFPHTHTLSNSTSLPTLVAAPSPRRSFAIPSSSQPDLLSPDSPTHKPDLLRQTMAISYPLLQPNRVPLPLSAAASANVSQETLARHDSRT